MFSLEHLYINMFSSRLHVPMRWVQHVLLMHIAANRGIHYCNGFGINFVFNIINGKLR